MKSLKETLLFERKDMYNKYIIMDTNDSYYLESVGADEPRSSGKKITFTKNLPNAMLFDYEEDAKLMIEKLKSLHININSLIINKVKVTIELL